MTFRLTGGGPRGSGTVLEKDGSGEPSRKAVPLALRPWASTRVQRTGAHSLPGEELIEIDLARAVFVHLAHRRPAFAAQPRGDQGHPVGGQSGFAPRAARGAHIRSSGERLTFSAPASCLTSCHPNTALGSSVRRPADRTTGCTIRPADSERQREQETAAAENRTFQRTFHSCFVLTSALSVPPPSRSTVSNMRRTA